MKTRNLLPVLVFILGLSMTAVQAQDRILELNHSESDSLASSDAHSYTVDLEAGKFILGEVNQKTVDVVVTVVTPDNKTLGTFDNSARGPEIFQFSTEATGPHRVEIEPFEQQEGQYNITLNRIEPIAKTPGARVDQLMAVYDGDEVPGGIVAFIKDGKVAFSKGYGMANLTHDVPFSTETPSNVGSISKQFTAFAIMLLSKDGKLSIDDDIRKYIPELTDFGKTITLRHLMTHTSGYREYLETLALAGRQIDEGDHISPAEVIEIIQRQPELQNNPGTEWNYNNTGYSLLATVVERVTDVLFPNWIKENVFEPLDMHSTVVRAQPSQVIPGSAQGYRPAEDGGYRNAPDLSAAVGPGGIYTTVSDLAKWIENLETGELGGKNVIRQMTTPYVLAGGDTTDYGFGLRITEQRGLRRIQHGGADIAHRAMLMYYPKIDAGVVAMSNNSTFDPRHMSAKVAKNFLGEYMTEETSATGETENSSFDPEQYDPEGFEAFAGKYRFEDLPMTMTFTREDNEFFTQPSGQVKKKITPTSDSTFTVQDVEVHFTFHRGIAGKADSLTLHQNGEHRAHRMEPWMPSEEDRAAYTGRYFSKELQTFYTIAEKDSGIVVQHRRMEDSKLTPTKEDAFGGEYPIGKLIFMRDEAGQITGLTISNGRTRNVHFKKQEE